MLTPRQNFLETIRGGSPERFVNQYEYMTMLFDPIIMHCSNMVMPGQTLKNDWGVTITFEPGTPGPFPLNSPELNVIKDISTWRDDLKAPDPWSYPEEEWAMLQKMAQMWNPEETFGAAFVFPGIFETMHHLMGMEETLVALLEEPDECRELIELLADWEIECAKAKIEHLHPDMLFHHDDFGSQQNSFFPADLFEELFVPAYKRVYGFWRDNGVEVIVHHSDSYAANLVPGMIEMGADVWQGACTTNDIPGLLEKYGPQLSIHSGMDSGKFDEPNWSEEKIRAGLEHLVEWAGKDYLIPGLSQGGNQSTFPGVYDAVTREIDKLSEKYFPGFKASSIERVYGANPFSDLL